MAEMLWTAWSVMMALPVSNVSTSEMSAKTWLLVKLLWKESKSWLFRAKKNWILTFLFEEPISDSSASLRRRRLSKIPQAATSEPEVAMHSGEL